MNAKPKFIEPRPYADPEAAARKLMDLANAVKPVQDGRIHVEKINGSFLFELKGNLTPFSSASGNQDPDRSGGPANVPLENYCGVPLCGGCNVVGVLHP